MTSILVRNDYGTDVSSRTRASELRSSIEGIASQGNAVELDFSGVRTISPSFADELFGLLVERHGEEWFRTHVHVANLSSFVRKTILEAVANRLHEAV